MFEKYIKIDIISLIKDSEEYLMRIEALEAQLEAEDGLYGRDYSSPAVGTSKDPDKMAGIIDRRIELERKLDAVKKEREVFSRAWASLTEEERLILSTFYLHDLNYQEAAYIIMDTLNIAERTLRLRLNTARNHLQFLLFSR